jgi:hypothetical protein
MAETQPITATLVLERTTPGTYLFKEVDSSGKQKEQRDSQIGNLYVRKSAFNGGPAPQQIEVTVTVTK